ncbi:MAG: TetR/AcrR family transcriptional regulator [Pseudoclavibacter sp.]
MIEAAERVALRDGLDGLTFQAIGEELGAHPTSVYRHIRDKDELLLELVDSLRARSYGGTLTPTDDWIDDLRRLAHTIHDHYMRYPEFAMQMAARTTRRPTEFSTVEFSLDALRRGGFSPEEAALLSRAMGNLVRSASSIESSMLALPVETRMADELAWKVDYRQLDSEQYPNITSAGGGLPAIDDPRAWETALELMLEAISARAAARAES